MPDPTTFQVFPFEGGCERRERPDVLRHPAPRRLPVLGRPAPRAAPGALQGRREGLHLLHPPGDRVLPGRGRPRRRAAAGAGRRGRLLRAHHPLGGPGLPPPGGARPGAHRHLRGVQPPRGRPRPAGDRPALRRRADHRRQHHDLPARGQGGGALARRAGHLHAEALQRPARQRHAHPPVAVRGRAQRLPRRRRPDEALQGRPGLHRRAAHPRPRVHRGHQPVGQLLQAALPAAAGRPDHRVARVRLLGSPEPLGTGAGAGVRQAELGPGRDPLTRLGRQPVPGLRGDARRRASRASRRATSCPRAPRTTSGRSPTPSARRWGTRRCPRTSPRRST